MDYAELVLKVNELAKTVGAFIHEELQHFDKGKIELKGLNDLVSYVDKNAEIQIVEGLKKILPEAGFITEEDTATETKDTFNWIVDPLDGTTNFTHGLPVFAVSIALIKQDKLVLGTVYEVNRKECFYATYKGGAFCNGKPITVSSTDTLSSSLLATGFPYYDFVKMPAYLAILEDLMRNTHGLRRMGSAAVDLAYVACGRFEGFFEYNLNAWDVAAGALIVVEAGGEVSDFKGGNDYLFGREIIASGRIQNALSATIQRNWNG